MMGIRYIILDELYLDDPDAMIFLKKNLPNETRFFKEPIRTKGFTFLKIENPSFRELPGNTPIEDGLLQLDVVDGAYVLRNKRVLNL